MNTDTGIYKITSPSGNFYIGSSISFKKRWREHLQRLRVGNHHSIALQRAFDKYGEASMRFEKIALCPVTDLIAVEQRFIDWLRPAYNRSPTAGSILGMKLGPCSEETRRKISEANKGRRHDAETTAHIARVNRGKKRSPEILKRFSEAQRGKVISEEQRRKISEALTGRRGKPHSPETKAKMSAAKSKPVVCIETGIIFKSGRAAAGWLRSSGHPTASNSHISSTCSGKLERAYGYTWRFA